MNLTEVAQSWPLALAVVLCAARTMLSLPTVDTWLADRSAERTARQIRALGGSIDQAVAYLLQHARARRGAAPQESRTDQVPPDIAA